MENLKNKNLNERLTRIEDTIIYIIMINIVILIFTIAIGIRINMVYSLSSHIIFKQANTINKQSKNDSLFMVHLSKCSFISNDRITVGYNGYLKVKNNLDK